MCICVSAHVFIMRMDLKPCEIEDRDPERWEEKGDVGT